MPRLIVFTIDVEFSSHPGTLGIIGNVRGTDYGLFKILDTFECHGVCVTCFVDVYGYQRVGVVEMRRICQEILRRGHDIQLHTHPSSLFDSNRVCMKDYTFTEQVEILRKGVQLFTDFVGKEPAAHRAGDWGANHETLRAIRHVGMSVDSSIYHRHPFSHFQHAKLPINKVFIEEGIIQIPPTIYHSYSLGVFRPYRNLDINFTTFQEFRYLLRKSSISSLVVTLHSFSLLGWNESPYRTIPMRSLYWINDASLKKLVKFLSLVVQERVAPITIKKFWELYYLNPSSFEEPGSMISMPLYLTTGRVVSEGYKRAANTIQPFIPGMKMLGKIGSYLR